MRCISLAASAVLVVSACVGSGSGSGRDVARVEAEGDVPSGSFGVIGDVFLGFALGSKTHLVRSDDEGRTWARAALPDAPGVLELSGAYEAPFVHDGLVVVGGRDPRAAPGTFLLARRGIFVWASEDGHDWTGQALDTSGRVSGDVEFAASGSRLIASVKTLRGLDVFVSEDRGATWADGGRTDVPPCRTDCGQEGQHVTGLIVRRGEASTDGGRTWAQIQVDPAPPPGADQSPYFPHVARVDGGWLASATSGEVGDISHGQLLRSSDGAHWEQLLDPERCADLGETRPNSTVRGPVAAHGRWYVTYHCGGLGDARIAEVLSSDNERADSFDVVDGTSRSGVSFGHPVVDGDRVLVPELDGQHRLVAISTIE
jgi:photosystem II stability/assembly factor-like uncharacterized protein